MSIDKRLTNHIVKQVVKIIEKDNETLEEYKKYVNKIFWDLEYYQNTSVYDKIKDIPKCSYCNLYCGLDEGTFHCVVEDCNSRLCGRNYCVKYCLKKKFSEICKHCGFIWCCEKHDLSLLSNCESCEKLKCKNCFKTERCNLTCKDCGKYKSECEIWKENNKKQYAIRRDNSIPWYQRQKLIKEQWIDH